MTQIQEDLAQRIRSLEKELQTAREEAGLQSRQDDGEAKFDEAILSQHKKFKQGLLAYIRDFRLPVVLTSPFIYLNGVAFLLLDLIVTLYQSVCFPVYGIPRVRRSDYLIFDRGRLRYLNILERLNCDFCSYVNGMCAYVTEVAARTEQYWCPIKHARRTRAPHSRYPHFIAYGDAQQYRSDMETVRNDFVDVRILTSSRPVASAKSTTVTP